MGGSSRYSDLSNTNYRVMYNCMWKLFRVGGLLITIAEVKLGRKLRHLCHSHAPC